MDIVDKATRSRMMANIKSKGTLPEMVVRSMLHGAGFRYRLHRKDLPGCPDIVLPKYRAAIFIHGCFWHLHQNCRFVKIPSSNTQFWTEKLEKNRDRDQTRIAELQAMGWRVLVVWECITREKQSLVELSNHINEWIIGENKYGELPVRQALQTA